MDYDLSSIQEARDLIRKAKEAQKAFESYTQEEVDRIVAAMCQAGLDNAEWLARMAVDETKYGVYEHKVIKNKFAAQGTYDYIKDMKTIGILKEDKELKMIEAAYPMGVVIGVVPSTNPTSTTIFKSLVSLKAGNSIVFAPHPNSARCIIAAAQVMAEAAVKAGAPEGIISCATKVTMQSTNELLSNEDVGVILATGGPGMVKASYSAGNPAYGVGAGNGPVFIEKSADIKHAVACIITGKSFDWGVICASENNILCEEPIKEQVMSELRAQKAYILSPAEVAKVTRIVMTPKGGVVAAMVGKSPQIIAEKAGINVPADTRVLVAPMDGYGDGYPLSYEKLAPILTFYTVKDPEEACNLGIELLNLMGIGHTFAIHSQNDQIIREFLRKPASRIMVNTPSTLGGIGYTTALAPSFTLGVGTLAGSSTSDNVTPMHLVNIKRMVWGIKNMDIIGDYDNNGAGTNTCSAAPTPAANANAGDIAEIVKQVMERMGK